MLLKRSLELTKPQICAWQAVLGVFSAEIINAAVVELALTDVRFPEVGDLYQICRRRSPKAYSPHGEGTDMKRPSIKEIAMIAERLGLK